MAYIFYLMASLASFFAGDVEEGTKASSDNTEKAAAFYHS